VKEEKGVSLHEQGKSSGSLAEKSLWDDEKRLASNSAKKGELFCSFGNGEGESEAGRCMRSQVRTIFQIGTKKKEHSDGEGGQCVICNKVNTGDHFMSYGRM